MKEWQIIYILFSMHNQEVDLVYQNRSELITGIALLVPVYIYYQADPSSPKQVLYLRQIEYTER